MGDMIIIENVATAEKKADKEDNDKENTDNYRHDNEYHHFSEHEDSDFDFDDDFSDDPDPPDREEEHRSMLRFEPEPPKDTSDLAKDMQIDINDHKFTHKTTLIRRCACCLPCLGVTFSCLLFTGAMTIIVIFFYRAIVLDKSGLVKRFPSTFKSFLDDLNYTEVNGIVLQRLKQARYEDCSTIYEAKKSAESGIYTIGFKYGSSTIIRLLVKCDMETMGGGWTVIQSRGPYENPEDYFARPWRSYLSGFGDEQGEFWMGLFLIEMFTSKVDQELLVELWSEDDKYYFAKYSNFRISDDGFFRLNVSDYRGTIGDALSDSNGQAFSTADMDRDSSDLNCAALLSGGWWFNNCAEANLNGLNTMTNGSMPINIMEDRNDSWGIFWTGNCSGKHFPIRWARANMKIRPKSFHYNSEGYFYQNDRC